MKNEIERDEPVIDVTFYYAQVDLVGDIKCEKYKRLAMLCNRVDKIIEELYPTPKECSTNENGCDGCAADCTIDDKYVFLLAIGDEIFIDNVTDNIFNLVSNGGTILSYLLPTDVHLFVFNSYEEAYKVALDMKEPNPLCYAQ
jgi:hypothetical protein